MCRTQWSAHICIRNLLAKKILQHVTPLYVWLCSDTHTSTYLTNILCRFLWDFFSRAIYFRGMASHILLTLCFQQEKRHEIVHYISMTETIFLTVAKNFKPSFFNNFLFQEVAGNVFIAAKKGNHTLPWPCQIQILCYILGNGFFMKDICYPFHFKEILSRGHTSSLMTKNIRIKLQNRRICNYGFSYTTDMSSISVAL